MLLIDFAQSEDEFDVISINKGDYQVMPFTLYDKDNPTQAVPLEEGDKLILTVRELPEASSPVILQTETETGEFVFVPSDTKNAAVGKYSADIQLCKNGNTMPDTIWPVIPQSRRAKMRNFENFIIMPEVTTV